MRRLLYTLAFLVLSLGIASAEFNSPGSRGTDPLPREPYNLQTFTATGTSTWFKPRRGAMALIRCWGAGGSGGRGGAADAGGGGGGGAMVQRYIPLSSLASTETVTIGTGGAARSVNDTDGATGGNSTFGSWVTAYGGGGGEGATADQGAGGGGAGTAAVGTVGTGDGTGTAAGNGGQPGPTVLVNSSTHRFSLYGGGSGAFDAGSGCAAPPSLGVKGTYGGGGGGEGCDATNNGSAGGDSLWGGAGGGGGNATTANAPGNGGTSTYGGNGGAGAEDAGTATNGSAPGGGGGGSESGNSGAGGNGKCEVYTF